MANAVRVFNRSKRIELANAKREALKALPPIR
jgi:hypothetical protein